MLNSPWQIGARTLANRVVFPPMEGCDCGEGGTPSELTVDKYLKAARSGGRVSGCAVFRKYYRNLYKEMES